MPPSDVQTGPADRRDFVGRVALVTGSSRGIGRGIALELARRGAGVVVHHRGDDSARAAEAVAEVKKLGGEANETFFDLADLDAMELGVQDIIKQRGRLDILVNNAGVCPFRDPFALDATTWDEVMAVNARGVFFASRAAARRMIEQGRGGRIINVTSISGLLPTDDRQVAYCASKAAANMITRSLARFLAPHQITVNAILPGTVPTDINAEVLADPALQQAIRERTPLGRFGTPLDIAAAAAFLASPEAAWITGALLVVDGGFTGAPM